VPPPPPPPELTPDVLRWQTAAGPGDLAAATSTSLPAEYDMDTEMPTFTDEMANEAIREMAPQQGNGAPPAPATGDAGKEAGELTEEEDL